ncbi:MAG TPA: DUF2851 family protein [Saprospiraceae bacterium]|nr:DUF2851 family protein [Saprospiraceae bacterium]
MTYVTEIREDLLQYVWRTRKFLAYPLLTEEGETIEIIQYGIQNSDAGPDFSHARIRINGVEWAGNVEMHVLSSLWYKHKHDKDPTYDNVILHVVYERDCHVYRRNGSQIPCLRLKDRIPDSVLKTYVDLLTNDQTIPCARMIGKVNTEKISLWQHGLLIERLKRKVQMLNRILIHQNMDWEQATFIWLARYMGSRVNVLPFEMLARSIHVHILYKNRDQPLIIDALLFGQAGLLESSFKDEYPNHLKNEYRFLQKKYDLQPIDPSMWKFARLRPIHFPTIRIAQLGGIIRTWPGLFGKLTGGYSPDWITGFSNSKMHDYWEDHYRFDQSSKSLHKGLGKQLIHLLQINVLSPLLFLYGQETGDSSFKDRAIEILDKLPPENNKIIREWKSLSLQVHNAAQSQALNHLKTEYCHHRKCTHCAIGHEVINLKL